MIYPFHLWTGQVGNLGIVGDGNFVPERISISGESGRSATFPRFSGMQKQKSPRWPRAS